MMTMRPLMRILPLSCGLVLALTATAERVCLDLRGGGTKGPAAKALLSSAASPADAAVRRTQCGAGASVVRPLAVGDELALRLFDDVSLSLCLRTRTRTAFADAAFLAASGGADGLLDAVVLQTPEGLQVDVQVPAANRAYTVVSDRAATTVREFVPKAGETTRCVAPEPDLAAAALAAGDDASGDVTVDEDGLVTVDLLVAYDIGAAAYAESRGGLTNFADVAVAKMNTALANNGLAELFRFRLVGVTAVAAKGTDVEDALYAIRDGEDGWRSVKTARETAGADVVTTLIDTGSAYGTTGIGWALNSTDFAAFAGHAYNVCAIRAVESGHTMTHEVGHNMGAGHATAVNPATCSPGPQLYDCSAGYYFKGTDNAFYHTIMAYNADGYGKTYVGAPLFSSPDCSWAGAVAGDEDHDNAWTIRSTYVAVSKWRTPPEPPDPTRSDPPEAFPQTTAAEDSAFQFAGTLEVSLAAPEGVEGAVFYTVDGSDPTGPDAVRYESPFAIDRSTLVRAVFVGEGRKPSSEVRALYLERHYPVLPGEWTTDVEGAVDCAGRDGNLIVVLRTADAAGACAAFDRVAGGREFLAWAAVNGIYLIVADDDRFCDARAAVSYFDSLFAAAWDQPVGTSALPALAFARPNAPKVALGAAVLGGTAPAVGDVAYDGTAETLVGGLASVLSITLPKAPTVSPDNEIVKKFPFWLEMEIPDAKGEIHYTLDGSLPTATSGFVYEDTFRVKTQGATLAAATWINGVSLSSPFVFRTYDTKAGRYGTQTTPVPVPHVWLATTCGGGGLTDAEYETLAKGDSDGDTYLNWEEYLCGTDPLAGSEAPNGVPRCTIRLTDGTPIVSGNIEVPAAAAAEGWTMAVRGSPDLQTWEPVDWTLHRFFRLAVEKQAAEDQ